jgi:hypothetical protein
MYSALRLAVKGSPTTTSMFMGVARTWHTSIV